MSTIIKQWLQQKIADMEIARDEIPFGLDEDDRNTLAAMRIALASLEAEAVAWAHRLINKRNGVVHPWVYGSAEASPSEGDIFNIEVMPLYSAPTAPVSEREPEQMFGIGSVFKPQTLSVEEVDCDNCSHYQPNVCHGEGCPAAMIQGADGNSLDGWVACSELMPKKNDKVLIFIDFNSEYVPPSIHDAEFTGATFRRGGATVNVFPLEDGYGVTHWQPLPSPPAK